MFSSLTQGIIGKQVQNREPVEKTDKLPNKRLLSADRLAIALFAVGLAAFSFLYGVTIAHYHYPPYITYIQAKKALGALRDKYLTPSDPYFYAVGHNKSGTTIYDRDRASDGYTFFTGYRDGKYKGVLIDMEGNVLHEWHVLFSQVWPEAAPHVIQRSVDSQISWHGAHLFPNGDILLSFHGGNFPSGGGLVKLDKHSNVLWALPRNTHHDVHVEEDGTIYVAAHNYNFEGNPELNSMLKPPYVEDVILKVSPDGEILDELSILMALQKSNYRGLLSLTYGEGAGVFSEDPTHLNTVETLPKDWAARYPMLKAGDLLVSLRNINTIAVIDSETKLIKWATTGLFMRQHDPDFLENGNILLFDNQGGSENYDQSRIIEIDPASQKVVWQYSGTRDMPFFSEIRGKQQPLPNGNILVVEPEDGRIFEVTKDQQPEVVWEYYNSLPPTDGERRVGLVTMALRFKPEVLTFVESSLPQNGGHHGEG